MNLHELNRNALHSSAVHCITLPVVHHGSLALPFKQLCHDGSWVKKYRIRETKHLSTNADKILLEGQKFAAKKTFFFMAILELLWDHFFPLLFPIGLQEVGAKKRLNIMKKWKICNFFFFCRSHFRPFVSNKFQIWDQFFPLLFSKDSEYIKSLYIRIGEMGANRLLKGVKNTNSKKSPAQ